MFYTVALYGPVFNTIITLMMGYVLMKIIEDFIKVLGIHKVNIAEQNSSIEILNSNINDLQNINSNLQKTISNLEKRIQENWTFISEEVNDIYPAIKAINTEIMLIKNKISG